MKPREIIAAFDAFLAKRGLELHATIVGGAALSLLGVIERETKDCDVLQPILSDDVAAAALAFAVEQREAGQVLRDDWLNNGPSSLVNDLPDSWQARLQPAFSGTAIEMQSLGRLDLIRVKVWALCDRGLDLPDCLALAPTAAELGAISNWLEAQDTNPDWPAHVQSVLADLSRRLGHGA